MMSKPSNRSFLMMLAAVCLVIPTVAALLPDQPRDEERRVRSEERRGEQRLRPITPLSSLLSPTVAAMAGDASGGDEQDQREQNRLEIERMTPAQRAQLERNFQAFLAMSEQERQKYRDLHRQLQQAPDAAALMQTMLRYTTWLEGLSPFQREQLRQTSDISSRMELVRRFKAEQSSPASLSEGEPRLSRNELRAMMNVVAADLELPPQELSELPELERHLHILSAFIRANRNEGRFRGWSAPFSEELAEKMIAALPPGEFREAISEVRRFKEAERRIVAGNIFEALQNDVSAKVGSITPTPEDLNRTLEHLRFDDRRHYHSLESKDEKNEFLVERFHRWKIRQMGEEIPELRWLFFQWSSPRYRDGSRRGFSRGGRDADRGPRRRFEERKDSPDDPKSRLHHSEGEPGDSTEQPGRPVSPPDTEDSQTDASSAR